MSRNLDPKACPVRLEKVGSVAVHYGIAPVSYQHRVVEGRYKDYALEDQVLLGDWVLSGLLIFLSVVCLRHDLAARTVSLTLGHGGDCEETEKCESGTDHDLANEVLCGRQEGVALFVGH